MEKKAEKKEILKTVDIKGKKYVEVAERVRYFNEAYPKGYINTEIISHENGLILMKAIIIPDIECPTRAFTGYAQEEKGKGVVNALSYIENCETSAVGRALGFLGIGVETSIRSADEMRNVALQNGKPKIKEPEALDKPTPEEKQPEGESTTPKEEKPRKPLSTTQRFINARKALGDKDYFFILNKYNVKSANEFKSEEKALEALQGLESVSIEEFNEAKI